MKKVLCGVLFAIAALVGYRAVSDLMEESRDFR